MHNTSFVRPYTDWLIFRDHKAGKFYGFRPMDDDTTYDYDSIDEVIKEIDDKFDNEHDALPVSTFDPDRERFNCRQ